MDGIAVDGIEEGLVYDMRVDAKGARGEGIGKIGKFVVLVKNAKTRIGNIYKVKVTQGLPNVRVCRIERPEAPVHRQWQPDRLHLGRRLGKPFIGICSNIILTFYI